MNRTEGEYEAEAIDCLAIADDSNVGTSRANYWLARAQVFATLAVAATSSVIAVPVTPVAAAY